MFTSWLQNFYVLKKKSNFYGMKAPVSYVSRLVLLEDLFVIEVWFLGSYLIESFFTFLSFANIPFPQGSENFITYKFHLKSIDCTGHFQFPYSDSWRVDVDSQWVAIEAFKQFFFISFFLPPRACNLIASTAPSSKVSFPCHYQTVTCSKRSSEDYSFQIKLKSH